MSEPPIPEAPDEVDDRYRRASALDPSRPGEAVRRRVLEHARQLAAEHASRPASVPQRGARWWRPAAVFGTLAAAALACLLIAPRFLMRPLAAPRVVTEVQQSRLGERPPAISAAQEVPRPPPAPASSPVAESRKERLETYMGTAPAADSRSAATNAVASTDTAVVVTGAAAKQEAGTNGGRLAMAPPAPNVTDAAAALRQAAETGDLNTLDGLLAKPSDINSRDAAGRTPLMLAVLHAQTDAVSALLAYGADPNAADAHGTTPLQAARAAGRPAIIAALRRYGAR